MWKKNPTQMGSKQQQSNFDFIKAYRDAIKTLLVRQVGYRHTIGVPKMDPNGMHLSVEKPMRRVAGGRVRRALDERAGLGSAADPGRSHRQQRWGGGSLGGGPAQEASWKNTHQASETVRQGHFVCETQHNLPGDIEHTVFRGESRIELEIPPTTWKFSVISRVDFASSSSLERRTQAAPADAQSLDSGR